MSAPSHAELVARLKAAREVEWASFRHNWPMLAYDLLMEFGGATLLGVPCFELLTLMLTTRRVADIADKYNSHLC